MIMKKWHRIEPTKVQKVGYRKIMSKTFKMPDGSIKPFETYFNSGACVIALTPENKVIVARQFRPGPEMIMDELPGGAVDEGERPEQTMQRELLEETGYEAGTMKYLGAAYYDAYTSGKRHCFLAKNCKPSNKKGQLSADEYIEIREISIGELLRNARAGLLTDPGAVLFAYEELVKLQKKQ